MEGNFSLLIKSLSSSPRAVSSEGIYCAVSQDGGKPKQRFKWVIRDPDLLFFFFPSWEEVILWEGNICSVLWCNTKPWPALLFGGMGEEWVCSWGLLLPTPSACSQHSKELQRTPSSRKAAQQIPRLTAALKDNKKTKIFQSITTLCLSFQWLWGTVYLFFKLV